MQIVINISEEDYEGLKKKDEFNDMYLNYYEKLIVHGIPLPKVLDKIRAEIEQTEINGHIRDVECFRAGINVALNVIDKYKAESEG